jgi:hypothetical protein
LANLPDRFILEFLDVEKTVHVSKIKDQAEFVQSFWNYPKGTDDEWTKGNVHGSPNDDQLLNSFSDKLKELES